MYKGKPTKGLEFYRLLETSEIFTSELGKVILASGKLEAELINLLERHNVSSGFKNATLGRLINISEQNNILNDNDLISLKMLKEQRNYIMHNIYGLFVDLKDETILEKHNLFDTDVELYIEKAWQLKENLNSLSAIISKKNKDYI